MRELRPDAAHEVGALVLGAALHDDEVLRGAVLVGVERRLGQEVAVALGGRDGHAEHLRGRGHDRVDVSCHEVGDGLAAQGLHQGVRAFDGLFRGPG